MTNLLNRLALWARWHPSPTVRRWLCPILLCWRVGHLRVGAVCLYCLRSRRAPSRTAHQPVARAARGLAERSRT